MFLLSDTNKDDSTKIAHGGANFWLIEIFLGCMGILIILFNIQGYEELFSIKNKIFGLISVFGLMLACAEASVLVYSQTVIRSWPDASRVLKWVLGVLAIAFWLLSFTGINSYLKSLSSHEEAQVSAARSVRDQQTQEITNLTQRREQYNDEIGKLRALNASLSDTIKANQAKLDEISGKMNQRRRAVPDCSAVVDCTSQVAVYQQQIDSFNSTIKATQDQFDSNSKQLSALGESVALATQDIRRYTEQASENLINNAGSEYKVSAKQTFYEEVVKKICGWFGYQPKDPFDIFIAFIAGLVYPVYFALNLLSALNSPANRQARAARRQQQASAPRINAARQECLQVVNDAFWLALPRTLQAIRTVICFITREIWQTVLRVVFEVKSLLGWLRGLGTGLFNPQHRLKKYLRVWAARRQKVLEKEVERLVEVEKIVEKEVEKRIEVPVEVEVEKIVERVKEVPVEVEKLVEKIKEVPVEVRIEVPVEVERLIPVDKEIPVYIERIQKIPEPYFIPDPQVVIHERIIPVPENITGKELEELLNAQPGLNDILRHHQEETAGPARERATVTADATA